MTLAANVTFLLTDADVRMLVREKILNFYFFGEDWRKIESIPESKCGN